MDSATEALLSVVKQRVKRKISENPRVQALLDKINSGKATFKDTAEYSEIVSNTLGAVFSGSIPEMNEAGLKEYICTELLKDSYNNTNDVLATVQKGLDDKTGVSIAPQKADFPTERVDQIAHSLEDPTVDIDVIQRRANAPVANVSKSFHDDYIKENAEFRSNAGLKCYIDRVSDGNCCAWCDAVAGRYEYGQEPSDIYRRHDNCGCSVTYESGRTRQDVWSKKSWEAPEPDKQPYSPTVFDNAQAKTLQDKNLRYKGVDKTGESGIIELRRKPNRKEKNIGVFSNLQIPMQKRYVLQICKNYNIDTNGLTFKINRSEKMLAMPFYGSTDYNNIGRVDLFPNAFTDEEQLLRTVIHEKCHVLQLKKHGKKYVQRNIKKIEEQAYRFENLYYFLLKKV